MIKAIYNHIDLLYIFFIVGGDKNIKNGNVEVMNDLNNPYNPGAGAPPPELAGRDQVLNEIKLAIQRAHIGKPPRNYMLLGLRGVGKTVLLQRILGDVSSENTVQDLEACPDRSLPEQITPILYRILIDLDRKKRVGHGVKRALGLLHEFAAAFEVNVGEFTIGTSGPKASGDLAMDLTDLMVAVGEAAQQRGVAVVLAIDEVQYLSKTDLAALITALHRISHRQLPLIFLGAGLPMLAKLAGEARSYAERLFAYPKIGRLDEISARQALEVPARTEGAEFTDNAMAEILKVTECYPFFLQVWGDFVWRIAESSPFLIEDVEKASISAIEHLDSGFFRVRYDRLTDTQQHYVQSMANRGPQPVKSAEVAASLGIPPSKAAPIRAQIVKKGMIYSPRRGEVAFTVPKFDEFILRIM